MKISQARSKLPFLLLLFSPLLTAADLSTYRGFQFGMSVNAAVKHSGMDASEVTVVHEHPARIQELSWRPSRFSSSETDPVEQVSFSFYKGQLFRMVVDYDTFKMNGLTPQDIIEAVSAKYGTPAKPGVAMVLGAELSDDGANETVQVLARWEDPEYSFNLVQLPYGSTFKLLLFSKRVSALADAAIAEGIRLETQEAPALLEVQEMNAKTDLNKSRMANKANFRP